jgi:acetyl esterase/lipase
VVILPGGGFGKVVPNKEGTEPAVWLNRQGIAAFVLSYRTKQGDEPGWKKPLQDAQRTLSIVRARADEWNLKRDRIGLLGFSAGGQVAARLLGAEGKLAYPKVDEIDSVSHWPNFAMLIYPWNLYEPASQKLAPEMQVPRNAPATFLAHTDDDRASSLSSALYYLGLKQRGIPAELHVYENGGHGYGLRPVQDSQIATWTEHAAHWLHRRLKALP